VFTRPDSVPNLTRVLLAASVLGATLFGLCGCAKKEPPPPPRTPEVTVAPPVRKTVAVYGQYVGQVDSPHTVELRARVEGALKEIHFTEGQEVEQGAVMLVIDPDEYQVAEQKAKAQLMTAEAALLQARNVKDIEMDRANVEKASAELANAEQNLRDMEAALQANALPRSQLDTAVNRKKQAVASLEGSRAKLLQSEADFQTRVAQAEAALATGKAAVAEAALNMSYTIIRAPVKGRVGLAAKKVGDLVGANNEATLLATISLVDPMQVYFSVSERELFEMRKLAGRTVLEQVASGALKATMILEDGKPYADAEGKPFVGRLDFADRALDAGTGTLTMRAVFPNPEKFLRPGNYARVRLALAEKPEAMLVSERALCTDQAGSYVLVVNEKNTVEQRPVKTGPKEDGLVVIESGLKPDEMVVVKGLLQARPGSVVDPKREAAPASAEAPAAGPDVLTQKPERK
jgi:membrane fusion protein (multidrug efflux system)